MLTSFRACWAPYQRLRCSSSTMPGSMIAFIDILLDRRHGGLPAETVPCRDGEEIQDYDDRQQQQRRGEHHGARGVDVRRLEAHVVDVEAQVHELAVEVHERPEAIDRQ